LLSKGPSPTLAVRPQILCQERVLTCFQAFYRESSLSQEVLVTKHVFLIHHKAEEGKFRVTDLEVEGLSWPHRV
jgi:hypothetical protein